MSTTRCCSSSHDPPDTACKTYERGQDGHCVYCDHEEKCHPGPGGSCWVFRGEHELTDAEMAAATSEQTVYSPEMLRLVFERSDVLRKNVDSYLVNCEKLNEEER